MSEGRTSAADADVEGEDRSVDGPASTGTADATGSAGTNGHETGSTTSGAAAESGAAKTDAGTTDATKTDAAKADTGKSGATKADAGKTGATKADAGKADAGKADATKTDAKADVEADDEPTLATVPAATLPGDSKSTPAAEKGGKDAKAAKDAKKGAKADPDAEADGDEEWADAEDKAYHKEMRKGFAFGAVGGILIGAIVALLLGALVWPGYLLGPGNPDDTANQITTALSAKDGPTLDRLSCKGANGQPVTQLSGQVLQYITKVAPAGPTTKVIDTEARTPIDVTLSVQGQTQTLPSELVLGESQGDWCLKGLAQRQQ